MDVGADKRIRMTNKGMEGGEDIARRHRLVEWMVVKILGMEPHQAHIEAHRLEHGVSPQLEERLFELLGQPTKSPFGRPIPGTGEPKTPPNSISLDRAATNEAYVVERIPEEDPNLLRFLVDSQVVPDSNIEVADAAPYLGSPNRGDRHRQGVGWLQRGPADPCSPQGKRRTDGGRAHERLSLLHLNGFMGGVGPEIPGPTRSRPGSLPEPGVARSGKDTKRLAGMCAASILISSGGESRSASPETTSVGTRIVSNLEYVMGVRRGWVGNRHRAVSSDRCPTNGLRLPGPPLYMTNLTREAPPGVVGFHQGATWSALPGIPGLGHRQLCWPLQD